MEDNEKYMAINDTINDVRFNYFKSKLNLYVRYLNPYKNLLYI